MTAESSEGKYVISSGKISQILNIVKDEDYRKIHEILRKLPDHSTLQQESTTDRCHVCRTLQWDNRLIWSLESLLAWVRANHIDQIDIRDHIDLMLGEYRNELELRREAPKERQKTKQPVIGCWYYDHQVCGLPHPSPVAEAHDAAIELRMIEALEHIASTGSMDAINAYISECRKQVEEGAKESHNGKTY